MPEPVHSFAPIAAPDARVLILGTMPGVASLLAGQYYAHPRNAFWRIMGDLFGAGPDLPYDQRAEILRRGGVAVWDVLQSCVRPGSLDADIRAEVPNDFAAFFRQHKHIRTVGLNGGKAAACFRTFGMAHAPAEASIVQLPSTSPAATLGFAQKCAAWRSLLGT